MLPSRGMGDINPSKMPKGKKVVRKDNPNDVEVYKKGGKTGKKNWISDAIRKPGALHEQLGIPKGDKIPAKTLKKAAKKSGTLGRRARLAETLKGMK